VPAGDADAATVTAYLAHPAVLAVESSQVVRPEHLLAQNWAAVTARAGETVREVHRFEVAHVGVSTSDAAEAEAVALRFGGLFGFEVKLGNSSNFAGTAIEVMKGRSRGTLGHIAIRATNIDRAVMYLSRAGVRFVAGSEKRSPDGRLKAVYLEEEVAGFALHLLQAG
jgi:2-dehydro-3-deoxyphosphogluconate aldolase/(4S)-4-hydroxy-2-oxoglutarate aldolase